MNSLVSIAYFPPVEYLFLFGQGEVSVNAAENYRKQTYKNRMLIAMPTGIHTLSLPVKNHANHTPVRDIKIDYKTPWQRNHWKTIESAYGNSPYFIYYQDYIIPFFQKKIDFLFDYDMAVLETMLSLFNIKKDYSVSDVYASEDKQYDFRAVISSKNRCNPSYPFRLKQSYNQVFDEKNGFLPFLSSLDLLFNMGSEAALYLQKYCTFVG